jgi:GNAT superfamily N-acetyltransferase
MADHEPTSTQAATTAEIPQLTTFQASADNDKHHTDRVDALRLIADSVAQQRQDASRAIITHPAAVAAAMGVVAVIFQLIYKQPSDLATVVMTSAGILMAAMAGVGYLTYGYLDLAEKTGTWSFLRPDSNSNKEDILLVTKYGQDIIGALVLRLLPAERTKTRSKSAASNKAAIRAWTVRRRYRHRGVGTALLEEAVILCKNNDWEGPEFDENHANSRRILPKFFQRGVEQREARARILLEDLKARVSK